MFTSVLTALLLPVIAVAQNYGAPPGGNSPASSSSSAPAAAPSAPPSTSSQINVNVAFQSTFTFNPANITAPNGTLVTFFFPNSGVTHSVTQSSFANPCTYLAANGSTPAGFDSGLTAGTQFTINITDDTKPIWFHCKQATHCGAGMVGSINAPTTGNNTFDAFMASAKAIGAAGEPVESTGPPVTGGAGAVATAGPTTMSASAGSGSGSSSDATKIVASGVLALLAAALACVMA